MVSSKLWLKFPHQSKNGEEYHSWKEFVLKKWIRLF